MWADYDREGLPGILDWASDDADWRPHSSEQSVFRSTADYRAYVEAGARARHRRRLDPARDLVARRRRRGARPAARAPGRRASRTRACTGSTASRDGKVRWTASSPDLARLLADAGLPGRGVTNEAYMAMHSAPLREACASQFAQATMAGSQPGRGLAAPRDGVHDRPAADALAVELELLGELIEPPADAGRAGSGSLHQLRAAVAHQRGAVERGLADQRLGVDREPAAVLVEQHVAGVGVLVQDGRHAGARQQLARRGRRRGRGAAAGSAGGASFVGGPGVHHLVEADEGRARRGRRRPQAPQQAGRDRVGLRLVGQRVQRPGRGEALDQQRGAAPASASSSRAAPSPFQWASAAASCSLSGSGKLIFSTARRAVAPLGRGDERDRGRLERVAEPQIPLLGARRGEAGERGEPLRAHPRHPRHHAQPVRHSHAL